MAENSSEKPNKWYSYGPIVHNESVVEYLKNKGISSINDLNEIESGGIIIRSHGVPPELINQAEIKGYNIIDATCPLVKKVHDTAKLLKNEGYIIVVFGDIKHPEVVGIVGWAGENVYVVKNKEEAKDISVKGKVGVIAQTTKDEIEFYEIVSTILPKTEELRVFNTICSATKKRIQAARNLAKEVELMFVIGDKQSSNTNTLTKECINSGVKTYQIESASDIKKDWLKGITKIGVTAGASTPDWIIKEVLDVMNDEKNVELGKEEQAMNNNEENFANLEAEMADFESPDKGDIIKGTVIQVLNDEVMVDVGGKSEGIVPLRELTNKQDVSSAKEIAKVGDELEVLVLKWDDDGTILLSKKKVDARKALDKLEEDYKEDNIVEGTVINTVKGGLLVDLGVVAFLPASHIEDGYVKDVTNYLNKTLKFKIIEFNRNKKRGSQIVLSRKKLVEEEKNKAKEEFWSNVNEGEVRTGKVKRLVDYGAFVDIGGYEGLLHVSELDHVRVEHPKDILNEGDEIEVYILNLDREKERVSLSRKKLLKSPWEIVLEKFNEGEIIEGKVVRIAPFGAFVEIIPGVDGLVHISQLANRRVAKTEDVVNVDQKINAKILSIDSEQKKVSLSIKEAENDVERNEVDEYLENQE
ncbi:4-hydroxy-3-methylbut-2-enyl diphosphate reductase [Candidatus Syntrophocurvum alkaliphilum]|uniref:4-hydroxy-3-methylbut-2-enyl diphosphate reductase n=2 Tax=Candidatus Syntrophocurvum alkaliphilum TaxID=2293317 RepID=A0A6I6DAX5_9FIRM|nr:4-hydroxy-3-methylbut-2-enyl diphosphate reductase [Candidatus Syntrophocurvum alkaliphilum]